MQIVLANGHRWGDLLSSGQDLCLASGALARALGEGSILGAGLGVKDAIGRLRHTGDG